VTREYSSISVETTLNSGINTTATTMVLPSVGAVTALLGGVSLAPNNVDIFTVAIDHNTVNEEIVYVTGVSGDTLTISRGQAGTGTAGVSGIAHSAGASVKHVLTSDDLIFFRNSSSPAASYSFSGSTSGTTTIQASAVAGTNTLTLPPTNNDTLVGKATTDTLTNKTLTAPVISTITNTGTLTLPTSTDTLVGRATTDTLTNKTLTAPVINIATNAQTGTSYTSVLEDNGKMVEMNNTSANTFTVPLNSSVAYPVGAQINILQTNVGQTTVVATSGVTVNATPGLKIRAQWSSATLIKRATDTWVLTGDLSA
jgi:citrate lyase gamma subunit